jgi:hypothetical protein
MPLPENAPGSTRKRAFIPSVAPKSGSSRLLQVFVEQALTPMQVAIVEMNLHLLASIILLNATPASRTQAMLQEPSPRRLTEFITYEYRIGR